jgi:hypothetical protein
VAARGVVVIFASEFRCKAQPEDVTVLASGDLRRWLKKRPEVLDAEMVACVYEQARRGEVWRQ